MQTNSSTGISIGISDGSHRSSGDTSRFHGGREGADSTCCAP